MGQNTQSRLIKSARGYSAFDADGCELIELRATTPGGVRGARRGETEASAGKRERNRSEWKVPRRSIDGRKSFAFFICSISVFDAGSLREGLWGACKGNGE